MDRPGLRPTPDRVRETLFNWLQGQIEGSRCLDLFAGSGALGLEALSRGAAGVVMVEQDPALVRHLRGIARRWEAVGLRVVQGDALRWLARAHGPFDLAFIDPPYQSQLAEQACHLLQARGLLATGALVYVEAPERSLLERLPRHWTTRKEGRAGQVRYALLATGDIPRAEASE